MAPVKAYGSNNRNEVHKSWIAWCFERCNKADQNHALKELSGIARSLQSNFVCKKKAHGLMAWWLSMDMPHMVIFTDWREAKPLVENFTEFCSDSGKSLCDILGKSVHLCIIAQSPKIHLRALEWAKLNMNNEVKVIPQFSGPEIYKYAEDCMEQEGLYDNKSLGSTIGSVNASETPSENSDASDGASSHKEVTTLPLCVQETLTIAQSLSWTGLRNAVQDPFQAALLEKMIRETMVQVYED